MRHKMRRQDLDKAMPEMVGGSAGPEERRNKPARTSLAELAGGWSEKEAREFEESMRIFGKIDKGNPSSIAMGERLKKNVAPAGFPPVTPRRLRKVGEKIAELPGVEKVILFGSYARGNPTPDSDVDLLVVWKTRRPRLDCRMRISALFLDRSFPMDIVVRTPKQVRESLAGFDPFIQEVHSYGKVLYEKKG
jgi:predicted nucleotidyltransferase